LFGEKEKSQERFDWSGHAGLLYMLQNKVGTFAANEKTNGKRITFLLEEDLMKLAGYAGLLLAPAERPGGYVGTV
jgi:hypothetical protein